MRVKSMMRKVTQLRPQNWNFQSTQTKGQSKSFHLSATHKKVESHFTESSEAEHTAQNVFFFSAINYIQKPN